MAENSTIEWTDATWNPITGCKIVSPGCTNCYAMGLAGTRLKHIPSRVGLTVETKAGPVWNGQVRLNEEWLSQPLLWRRPRKIFVCAHGDLFAEGVPDEWIDRVFAVMAAGHRHTYQVLTKRSARMRAYLTAPDVVDRIIAALQALSESLGAGKSSRDPKGWAGWDAFAASENLKLGNERSSWPLWPLASIWLGVSAEDQRRADERVPDLLATPAAVRFVSAEPLLGPIDFEAMPFAEGDPRHRWSALTGQAILHATGSSGRPDFTVRMRSPLKPRLDWIIVGGESGPKARPMHPAWARQIRDACAAAGIAFHFKQHGAWAAIDQSAGADQAGWEGRGDWMILSADGDMDIPDDRWPDAEAGEVAVIRVGKKAAGRLLDGIEWNQMPEVSR